MVFTEVVVGHILLLSYRRNTVVEKETAVDMILFVKRWYGMLALAEIHKVLVLLFFIIVWLFFINPFLQIQWWIPLVLLFHGRTEAGNPLSLSHQKYSFLKNIFEKSMCYSWTFHICLCSRKRYPCKWKIYSQNRFFYEM